MKKWFINKFPDLISIVLIGYGCYQIGIVKTRHNLMINAEKCANTVIINVKKGNMSKFYGHKVVGNISSHAEALIEFKWSRCFRKEIIK